MKKKYLNWLIAFILLVTFAISLCVVCLDHRTMKIQKKVEMLHQTGV